MRKTFSHKQACAAASEFWDALETEEAQALIREIPRPIRAWWMRQEIEKLLVAVEEYVRALEKPE